MRMESVSPRLAFVVGVVCAFSLAPSSARACSSCGCTLSSDWSSQGVAGGAGLRVDLRADYFNQNQLRTGTGTVDVGSDPIPNERELQKSTVNHNYLLTADYSPNADWGINLQLPYFNRFHTTIAEGDTEISTSHTQSVGDIRLVGRYQGWSRDGSSGIQLGLKFATGGFHYNFIDGPQAGNPLDRGLQPGTGTTDLLVGLYKFGEMEGNWSYFAQALVQQPLNSREDFRPGTGVNANLGVRYGGFEKIIPQLQVNVRAEKRESGANADVENSGAALVYLSPGVTVAIANNLYAYGFVQVPIYQRVNGFQLEPRYSVSVGLHYAL